MGVHRGPPPNKVPKKRRRSAPVHQVSLGSVDDLGGGVPRAPVDAHGLGLLGLARGVVGGDAAEARVVDAERRREVPAHVGLPVHEAAARRARQVPVVVQVTCGQGRK